jgi:hypothetical protein
MTPIIVCIAHLRFASVITYFFPHGGRRRFVGEALD